jgi:hypothetical protein
VRRKCPPIALQESIRILPALPSTGFLNKYSLLRRRFAFDCGPTATICSAKVRVPKISLEAWLIARTDPCMPTISLNFVHLRPESGVNPRSYRIDSPDSNGRFEASRHFPWFLNAVNSLATIWGACCSHFADDERDRFGLKNPRDKRLTIRFRSQNALANSIAGWALRTCRTSSLRVLRPTTASGFRSGRMHEAK